MAADAMSSSSGVSPHRSIGVSVGPKAFTVIP